MGALAYSVGHPTIDWRTAAIMLGSSSGLCVVGAACAEAVERGAVTLAPDYPRVIVIEVIKVDLRSGFGTVLGTQAMGNLAFRKAFSGTSHDIRHTSPVTPASKGPRLHGTA